MGIFALTSQGLTGSTLYMFNHGLSTAALFLVAGYLISRRGSARIADYGGVEKVAPVLHSLERLRTARRYTQMSGIIRDLPIRPAVIDDIVARLPAGYRAQCAGSRSGPRSIRPRVQLLCLRSFLSSASSSI